MAKIHPYFFTSLKATTASLAALEMLPEIDLVLELEQVLRVQELLLWSIAEDKSIGDENFINCSQYIDLFDKEMSVLRRSLNRKIMGKD